MVRSLSIRPTTREDVRRVQQIEPWHAQWRNLDQDGMEGWLEVYSRTLVENSTGNPVALVGVVMLFPGVAEAWACISPLALRYPKDLIRHIREIKEFAFRELGIWRLQAPIQEKFAAGQRFAQFFGLQPEARLESWFHPEEAVILHSEIRK